ncbi:MAG: 6-bladed beta-propeller [Tannerella sp.]|jgi:hypothetical protein|nr:6-bladed beta-propeller [Tannerella sp.]
MKRLINTILIIILLAVMTGCGSGKPSTDELITVDVTAKYPLRELILQDFTDVEYVPLETTDDFLTQGFVLTMGKEIILVKNRINDGDIFICDRTGKALRKINRQGQGAEEYLFINAIVLDEDNREIFVNDMVKEKILVYDLYGEFKRSISYPNNVRYDNIHIYDREHLICYDSSINNKGGEARGRKSWHFIISKQNGSIIKEIYIPFEKNKSHRIISGEYSMTILSDDYSIIPDRDNWLLVELSSDTVYRYSPDDHLIPFIVRTPPVQSMETEIFLLPVFITDRYCFMNTSGKRFNLEKMHGYPSPSLMYDKQENTLFEYTVYNDDYSNKQEIRLKPSVNDEIAFWETLEANQLVESYRKGELKGRLKEVAAKLNEDDNPVIMLVKHKK